MSDIVSRGSSCDPSSPWRQAEDQARALHRAIRDASETLHVRDRTVVGCTHSGFVWWTEGLQVARLAPVMLLRAKTRRTVLKIEKYGDPACTVMCGTRNPNCPPKHIEGTLNHIFELCNTAGRAAFE